jgi:hypothetical protein
MYICQINNRNKKYNTMSTVPTAKEWLENHKELSIHDIEGYDEGGYVGVDKEALYKIMVEFAKFHVGLALEIASENAITKDYEEYQYGGGYITEQVIDEDSILNAYPLTNIK